MKNPDKWLVGVLAELFNRWHLDEHTEDSILHLPTGKLMPQPRAEYLTKWAEAEFQPGTPKYLHVGVILDQTPHLPHERDLPNRKILINFLWACPPPPLIEDLEAPGCYNSALRVMYLCCLPVLQMLAL